MKKTEINLPVLSLVVCAALYLVWPLAHTIALRKLLLVIGALIGITLWYRSENRYEILKSPWLIWTMGLFSWVVFHASFISQNGGEAWGELLGQWVPVLLAVLSGMGLALAIKRFSRETIVKYMLLVLAVQPVLFLIVSIAKSILAGHLVTGFMVDKDGVLLGTDLKTSLTFSSDLLGALSCARFVDVVTKNPNNKFNYMWLAPIGLSMYVALFIQTLNSTLLLGICIAVMVVVLGLRFRPLLMQWLAVGVIVLSPLLVYGASLSPNIVRNWERALSTTQIAFSIDDYQNWLDYQGQGLPVNQLGERVPESFYLRVAYATEGIRVALQHPWGYGVTRHAFERLVQQEHPEARIASAHSGYINLVCAVGFPALLLLVLIIVSIFRSLRRSHSKWRNPLIWMMVISLAHFGLDALERDHFMENYFFLLAVLAMMVSSRTDEYVRS